MKYTRLVLAIMATTVFISNQSHGLNIYEDQYGHKIDLYGEIGNGGHFNADNKYGEFNSDEEFIDDSFASLGIKGTYDKIYYKLEMDYLRENWQGGSGDMVLEIDKGYFGYLFTSNHALEMGLTDTAFDDYDSYGDFTFDTTVETGEASDQGSTIKYEGQWGYLKFGSSFSFKGKSESGSELGNVSNGYLGLFTDALSIVAGLETLQGSEGVSKQGKKKLAGLGLRLNLGDSFSIGLNGFYEEEYLARSRTPISTASNNDEFTYIYNQYEKLENKGWLASSKVTFNEKWELVMSHNYEEYGQWDESNTQFGDVTKYTWGKERVWQTLGINFKPYPSVIIAAEGSVGEADQSLYAYTRIYF